MTTPAEPKPKRRFNVIAHGETKEEQLHNMAKFIADDLMEYWKVWGIPLEWNKLPYKMRPVRAPLVSYDELKAYVITNSIREIRTFDNLTVYVPKEIEMTEMEIGRVMREYRSQHANFKAMIDALHVPTPPKKET